jgi:hypothetical protein
MGTGFLWRPVFFVTLLSLFPITETKAEKASPSAVVLKSNTGLLDLLKELRDKKVRVIIDSEEGVISAVTSELVQIKKSSIYETSYVVVSSIKAVRVPD